LGAVDRGAVCRVRRGNINSPLENTDGGWGTLILLALALPVAAGAALGGFIKSRAQR